MIYFAREGKGDLYKLPPRKEPPTNNWQDESGLECDLSAPLWASYIMELSFVLVNEQSLSLQALGSLISKQFPLLTSNCLLKEVSSFKLHKRTKAVELTCQYEVLDPMQVWQRFGQVEGEVPKMSLQNVALNGTDLGAMGIGVVDFYDSFLMPEKPKGERWLSESSFISGRKLAKSTHLYTKPQEVQVQCVIPYRREEQLTTPLSLLARDLQKAGKQTLNDRTCYYKEMTECKLTRSRFYFTLYFQII